MILEQVLDKWLCFDLQMWKNLRYTNQHLFKVERTYSQRTTMDQIDKDFN